MQKNIVKTESVAEFIARGGQIKKLTAKQQKQREWSRPLQIEEVECVELTAEQVALLPEALKIRYGVR